MVRKMLGQGPPAAQRGPTEELLLNAFSFVREGGEKCRFSEMRQRDPCSSAADGAPRSGQRDLHVAARYWAPQGSEGMEGDGGGRAGPRRGRGQGMGVARPGPGSGGGAGLGMRRGQGPGAWPGWGGAGARGGAGDGARRAGGGAGPLTLGAVAGSKQGFLVLTVVCEGGAGR